MSGEGASLRSSRSFDRAPFLDFEPGAMRRLDPHEDDQLLRAARLVLSAFSEAIDAGELGPRRHSALLQLERALSPFEVPAAGTVRDRSPGVGLAHPCSRAGQDSSSSRPAADLTPGDTRHGFAMARPGA